MSIQSDHDSLIKMFGREAVEHIMQGRPYLLLLPHDELSEHTTRYYAALRGRKFHAIKDIVANGVVAATNMPFHHEKDPAHAISAQNVANRMYLWRREHQPQGPTNSRAVDLDGIIPGEGDVT